MSFPLLIQQSSWSYIDVLYIEMILGSISTFLVTGAFVDEHFLKPFLKQNDFPEEEIQNLRSNLSDNSEIGSPRNQAFDVRINKMAFPLSYAANINLTYIDTFSQRHLEFE